MMRNMFTMYRQLLGRAWGWLLFVAGVAIIWMVVGMAISLAQPELLPVVIEQLGEIFRRMLGDVDRQSAWSFALVLLRQNATSALLDVFGGVIVGIVPIMSIAVNFFALGFLAAPGLAPGLFPEYPVSLGVFVLAVAPHGVFELPALIIAAAFGLRLGWAWLLPHNEGQRGRVFMLSLKGALMIVPFVLVLLVIAAFIEAFITSRLLP